MKPNDSLQSEGCDDVDLSSSSRSVRFHHLRGALWLILPLGLGPTSSPVARPGCTRWLVPLGLLIGIAYACLYRVAWRCFGEVHGIRLMPAVCVWLVDVGFFGVLPLAAAARVADRGLGVEPPPGARRQPFGLIGAVALVIFCTLKLTLWIAIPEGVSRWPGIWGSTFDLAYPHAFYRPLILAPLWGRWGIVLASSIGRPAPDCDATVRNLAKRQSSRVVMGWFLPIAGLTAVYCGYGGRWVLGCVVALGVLAGTFLLAVAATRGLGGQTRDTLIGAGFVAELSYLLLYTGVSVRIYAT